MWYKKEIHLEQILNFLIKAFLFLLPWQTIWIYREVSTHGYKLQWGTLGFYATEILLWSIVLVFLGWFWQKKKAKFRDLKFQISRDRIFVFSILLFTIYVLLSSVWALDSQLAWQHGLRIMEGFLLFFILFLGPLDFKSMARWLILGSILPVLLGIFQFVWQSSLACKWLGLAGYDSSLAGASIVSGTGLGRLLRAYGSLNHPNIFGGYLVIVILFLSLFSLKVRDKKFKIILFFTYCLLLTTLFFTFSRSALLALPVVLIIYYLSEKKLVLKHFFYKASLTILPIIILILILIPVLAVRVSGTSANEIESITERKNQVGESIDIFKNNMWLGVGAGNYTLALYEQNPNLPGWQYQPVHNVGLLLFSELGIVGIILIVCVFVSFIILNFSFIRKYLLLSILLLVVYCLLMCFDHYLYTSYVGLMLSGLYWGVLSKYNTQ